MRLEVVHLGCIFLTDAAVEEVLRGRKYVDPVELERIAAKLLSVAQGNDPERMAAALGVTIVEWRLPAEVPSTCSSDGRIRLRIGLGRRHRRRAIYHEIAHLLLLWFAPLHSHADVWLLTVILSEPGELFLGLMRSANDDLTLAQALAILRVPEA